MPRTDPDQIHGRRGKMIKESAVLTLTSWAVAAPATLMWDWGGPLENVATVASFIFFVLGLIGLFRFLYAFLFVKEAAYTMAEPAFPIAARRAALPPQQSIPLSDYPHRSNTKEIAPRHSVTEGTTRLLDEPPRPPEN